MTNQNEILRWIKPYRLAFFVVIDLFLSFFDIASVYK